MTLDLSYLGADTTPPSPAGVTVPPLLTNEQVLKRAWKQGIGIGVAGGLVGGMLLGFFMARRR